MRTYSFYHKATGRFSGTTFATDDPTALAANIPADHEVLEGAHDHLSRQMNLTTGAVEDYQPQQPSADHEWNETAKRWQLTPEAQEGERQRQLFAAGATERRLTALESQLAELRAQLAALA